MHNDIIFNDGGHDWQSQVSQNDHQSLSCLYDQYAPLLMGLLTRLTEEREIANAALQKLFENVWRNRAVMDGSGNRFFTLLVKLARLTAHEMLSKEENKGHASQGTSNKSIEIVNLVFCGGYNFATVATMLGITVDQVKEKLKATISELKGQPA